MIVCCTNQITSIHSPTIVLNSLYGRLRVWKVKVVGFNLLYKAEKPSVHPSSAFFGQVDISVICAWIDVRLARNDSPVIWHDEFYFKSF